jgi:hypothetical protein
MSLRTPPALTEPDKSMKQCDRLAERYAKRKPICSMHQRKHSCIHFTAGLFAIQVLPSALAQLCSLSFTSSN